jgi:hypothetical protein
MLILFTRLFVAALVFVPLLLSLSRLGVGNARVNRSGDK